MRSRLLVLVAVSLSLPALASQPMNSPKDLSAEELLTHAQQSIDKLGAYTATLVKRERVKGELIDEQTIKLLIREAPFAARMEYVSGPGKGRKVVYDASKRPKEIRVKEGGLLGIAGGLWIGIDSALTRAESNHPITDLGLASLVRLMKRDAEAAKPHGGIGRSDEGLNKDGQYCVTFTAPSGATGLYAQKTKVCVDPSTLIPMYVEVHDTRGLLETYRWKDVKAEAVKSDSFTPESMGI